MISNPHVRHRLTRDLILAFIVAIGFFIPFSLAFSAEIRLAWDPSPDTEIAGYKIYYGRASGRYGAAIDVGNITGHTLVVPKGKYYIALTGYDNAGNESDFSNEVSWPIQMLEPNGGEALPSGSNQRIQWWASSEAVSFNLLYSTDNGTTWITIIDTLKGASGYDWIMPAPARNRKACLVKAIGYDSQGAVVSSDKSDSSFKIEVIRLTTPNTAETLISGNMYHMTWDTYLTKGGPPDGVELYYTKDGGTTWNLITVLDGTSESFNWLVPTVKNPRSQCKVKVVLRDGQDKSLGSDVSDVYFTIQP